MEYKKIAFFSATQKSEAKDTSLLKSTANFDMDIDIAFALENKEPLPVVYNRAIDNALKENWDALVFVHDDVILEHDPRPKLIELFKKFDMIGVAGASSVEIKSPALWHLMGGGFNSGKLHGAVAHGTTKAHDLIWKVSSPCCHDRWCLHGHESNCHGKCSIRRKQPIKISLLRP
jgi:hypothetical protein